MASPAIVDFETLLAPIPGASPAGEPLPFDVRKQLDDARKEVNLNQFAPNDPRRPEPQVADWPRIEQLAQDTLARTSKDFLVAARLTEALVKRHGFGGLRDGLRLMRRLTQECWDRLYPVIPPPPASPVIKEGDPEAEAAAQEAQEAAREAQTAALEARAAAFDWLDDDIRGARFPNTLRAIPLTSAAEGPSYGWQQWKDARDAKGSVTAEALDQAVAATSREFYQTAVDDLVESAGELTELTKLLGAKLGEAAPGLSQVRRALLECQELAQQILQRKGPAPVAAQNGDVALAGSAQTVTSLAAPRPLTRDDLLARLADASALLLQLEPQSPIAYLVQRAVKLARLPLPDLMRVLVRDPGVLGQLDRDLDLGLEKQEAAKGGKSK